jgi:hypothetical protein
MEFATLTESKSNCLPLGSIEFTGLLPPYKYLESVSGSRNVAGWLSRLANLPTLGLIHLALR